MTAYQHYVNTGSTSGGDGTTNGASGSTRAFASLSEWESYQDGVAGSGDTSTVDCCAEDTGSGNVADTTTCDMSGWTAGTTIIIQANRGVATGFYGGTDILSTAHYRMQNGSNCIRIISLEAVNITIDGLQFYQDGFGSGSAAINNSYGIGKTVTCKNNRLLTAHGQERGLDFGGFSGPSLTLDSNLVAFCGSAAIKVELISGTQTANIYNNTATETYDNAVILYNDNASRTFNIKNNVVKDTNQAGHDWSITNTGGTWNWDYNASDDAITGSPDANWVDISGNAGPTLFTSYGHATSSDLHLTSGGALTGAGISVGNATDADDNTRTSPYDIGCFDYPSAASGVTLDIPTDTLSQTDNTPGLSFGANVVTPQDGLTLSDNAPSVVLTTLISSPQDSLSMVDNAPIVAGGAAVVTPTDSLSEVDNAPGVSGGTNVVTPQDSLSITDNTPTVAAGVNVVAPDDALTITDNAPSVQTGNALNVPTDSLSEVDNAPAVNTGVNVVTPADSLTETDNAPTVVFGVLVSSPTDALSIVDNAPQIPTGASVVVPQDTLSQTDNAPSVSIGVLITSPQDALSQTDNAPSISTSFIISVPADGFTLVDNAPVINTGVTIIVPLLSFTETDYVPALSVSSAGVYVGVVNLAGEFIIESELVGGYTLTMNLEGG